MDPSLLIIYMDRNSIPHEVKDILLGLLISE